MRNFRFTNTTLSIFRAFAHNKVGKIFQDKEAANAINWSEIAHGELTYAYASTSSNRLGIGQV